MNQPTDTPTPDRMWRWFARIHHLKTGVELTVEAMKRDDYIVDCHDWWVSGYKCRQLDEESERVKEGVLK